MPKKKTRKSAAKRFKVSARGKVMYRKCGRGHLLTGKSRNRKRHLRKSGVLGARASRKIAQMLNF
jgi:large subunit ribosomal protein L35